MILISAGHHETSTGAKFDGHSEYEFTTMWTDYIEKLLGERCIRVPNGTLKEKVTFLKDYGKGNLAVEIHFNSAQMWKDQNANGVIDDGEMINVGRGSETLYYPGSKTGLKAATMMQNALSVVAPPNRGAKEGWYQMNRAKGPDYFLARTRCTALIIEPEFIDNIHKINQIYDTGCHIIANTLMEIEEELFHND